MGLIAVSDDGDSELEGSQSFESVGRVEERSSTTVGYSKGREGAVEVPSLVSNWLQKMVVFISVRRPENRVRQPDLFD